MKEEAIEVEERFQIDVDVEEAIALLNNFGMTVVFGRKNGQEFGLEEVRPQDSLRALTIDDEDEFAESKLDPDWKAPRPWEEAA